MMRWAQGRADQDDGEKDHQHARCCGESGHAFMVAGLAKRISGGSVEGIEDGRLKTVAIVVFPTGRE